MTLRVVVADDSLIVRAGLVRLLEAGGLRIVAEAGDGDELLRAVALERPDVAIADIRMPPTHTDEGIRAAAELRRTHPETGVVILSSYADPAYALALLESGLERRAYVLKERVHKRGELISAIDAVSRGGSVIDPKIVEVLVAERTRAERSPLAQLTDRELEVLAEIATGKSNHAIADSLVLTKRAVEKHINSIFLKLGLADADDVAKRVKAALMFLADQSVSVRH